MFVSVASAAVLPQFLEVRDGLKLTLIVSIEHLLQDLVQLMHLLHVLLEVIRKLRLESEPALVPLLADPALRRVTPHFTVLNLIMAKLSREHNLSHISSHWLIL